MENNTEFQAKEEEVGKQIGINLRQFRNAKGITIEAFAKQIGVSKLTLIKIEQGEANPTLSVIWKIADGLHIPISALLSGESDVSVIRKQDSMQLRSSDEIFVVEPLFRSNGFELYRGYLQPHSAYTSEAHQAGVTEFVTVMSGQLTVEVNQEQYDLVEEECIRFKGDRKHTYRNPSESVAILHFVITYH